MLWLALAYRKARTYAAHNLADVIRLHRQEHARVLLEEACHLVLQTRVLQQVFARYFLAAPLLSQIPPVPTCWYFPSTASLRLLFLESCDACYYL